MTEKSLTKQNRAFATPPVDIFESNDAFKLIAEVPGVTAGDVSVSVEQDKLTLRASRSDQALDYRRRFTLNVPVDVENVKATLEQGILELDLPKAASAKPRSIPVQAH